MADPSSSPHKPYIPASTTLPEITVKAVILGAVLSVVLASANTYLGLFAGMTVSASIPAAVISMAILRAFKNHNILENNIVQTSASAGESLAAGVIFTFPALVILGVWTEFKYWEVTAIAGIGGLLGVLFTVPLRRALIVEQPLQFPEGLATAEVLKSGEAGKGSIKAILFGGLAGAVMKFGAAGMKLWGEIAEKASYVGSSIAYFGCNLSPALVGVGYIVGLNIAVLVFIGGALNWFIAIPYLASLDPVQGESAVDAAYGIWSTKTRYLGVGAMIVGGLWALIQLRSSLVKGIKSGFAAYKAKAASGEDVSRTEREFPMNLVVICAGLAVIPLAIVFWMITKSVVISGFMAVAMVVAGFLFSAVASYMAGLVGSSNNPISGVTIATILTSALLLLGLLNILGHDKEIGAAAAILIGAVVCCAAAIGGDNMQDLKAGHLLGATPRNQQIMQVIGVLSAALFMAPVLGLIQEAYGIGVPTAEHPEPLSAPQASLMAAVAKGVFAGGLPWGIMSVGMGIAVAVIILDQALAARGSSFRTPVLAVAVGIYLPFELSVPILLGGLIAHFARRGRTEPHRDGLLFAAGLITGEALLGILLAIPIVLLGKEALAVFGVHKGALAGVVLLAAVSYLMYRHGSRQEENAV
ncbi:MAG: oligopeptide transporter, OPT family [Verrucomicrobiales bacterium]|nr:oligopeptide transporter, OPT family [Verrucomicrobiaceae bacterium]